MSTLIESMLAQVQGKNDSDTIEVRVADLRLVCSQAMARGQMIAIYEEMLKVAAVSLTSGEPNIDLAQVILKAIAER